MAISQIVSLVVNILFGLFLLFGFLYGLRRGWKKALLRLGVLLVFFIIGSIISPYITKALLNIQITDPSGGGGQVTLYGFVENFLYSQEQLADLLTKSPELAELAKSLIVVVGNVIVFFVLMIVIRFISWIVFAIVAKYALKDKKNYDMKLNKDAQAQTSFDLVPMPPKKRKLIGGAIGIVQGFICALVFFLPLSGIVGTFEQLYTTEAVSAATRTAVTSEYSESGSSSSSSFSEMPESFSLLITENVPPEVLEIVNSYNKSAIRAVGGIGDFDLKCFDTITSFKNNGQKIVLRKELLNIRTVYNDAQFLFNLDFDNINFKTFEYERAEKAINSVFNFGLLRAVLPEIVPYFSDMILDDGNDTIDSGIKGEIKTAAKDIISNWGDGDVFAENLKSDILALLGVFKELGKSGAIDYLTLDQEINVETLVDLLIVADSKGDTVLDRCVESLFSSKTIKIGMVAGLNIIFNEAEKSLGEDIALGDIKYSDAMWNNVTQESKAFIKSLINSYNVYKNLSQEDKDFLESLGDGLNTEKLNKLLSLNHKDFLVNFGKALNIIKDSSVFKLENNGSIFKNLMTALENSDKVEKAKDYVDFTALKNDLNFEAEFTTISNILTSFKNSGLSAYVFDFKENLNEIIDVLNTRSDSTDSNSKKYLNTFVDPMIDSPVAKGILGFAITKFNDSFADYIGDGASELDASNSRDIAHEFMTVVEKALNGISAIDVEAIVNGAPAENVLKQEGFTNVLTDIGDALDSMKSATNLKAVYSDLIEKYSDDESISKYVNLRAALQNDYSWKTDLQAIKTSIDKMISYGIIDEIFSGSMDVENILDNFKDDPSDATFVKLNANDVFGPIARSKVLSKSIVFIVDMLNEQITSTLALAEEDKIPSLPSNVDVTAQADDFIALLNELIPMSTDFLSGSFDIETVNLVGIGDVMDAMKGSVYNIDGTEKYTIQHALGTTSGALFKGTYTSIIDYLKGLPTLLRGGDTPETIDDVTYGQKITEILDGYGDNPYDVDWAGLMQIVQTAKEIAGGESEITPENLTKVLEAVGENTALQNEVKTVLKDLVGDGNDELTSAIDNVTFDDTTIGVAEAIAGAATGIVDESKTDAEVVGELVTNLNTVITDDPENADEKINNLITIANSTVGDSVDLSSSANVEDIQNSVETLNVDDATKDNLYALLGITPPTRP